MTAAPIEFKTLNGEIVKFCPDEVVTPHFKKVFPGLGMPIYKDDPLSPMLLDHDRGDFILKFKIEFPSSLSTEKKERLVAVLTQN